MNEKNFRAELEEKTLVILKLSIIGKDYALTRNGVIVNRKSVRSVMDALASSLVDWVGWDEKSLWISFYDDREDVIRLYGEYNEWDVTLWTDGENHTIRFTKGNQTRKFKYTDKSVVDSKGKDLVDYIPFWRA